MLILLQTQVDSLAAVISELPQTVTPQQQISALEFIIKGGIFMLPIILLLIYTIYVMIERFLFIRKTARYDKTLLNGVISALEKGHIEVAMNTLAKDNTASARVIEEGVITIGRPIGEVEANMERVASIEVGNMEKKLNHLGLIAGIAPTLGFVGTILGVIKIFYSISISENISIGNISGGLYEKMISSGSGLIVGIIAYSAYHLLNSLIDNFTLHTQKNILNFINAIQRPNGNQTK